jgi:ribosomal-protein-alanine N-acetyltransferase
MMIAIPNIQTERTELILLTPDNAHLFLAYQLKNKDRLAPWEPTREIDYFSDKLSLERAEAAQNDFKNGSAIRFIAIDRESKQVAAVCNFTCITREPSLSCMLGYSVSAEFEGKGIMLEVVTAGIAYVFDTLGLHRITASYMPTNLKSAKLIQKLGFEREGFAKSYLRIAGKWEDMIVCSLINKKD